MKKILFYCQNLLGMGHLVRTAELIRELSKTFQVCLVDGGQRVPGFKIPQGIEVIQLPTLQVEVSDSSVSKKLCVVGSSMNLEEVKAFRAKALIQIFDRFRPDCLITEGYPFSKHKALAFEMIPFLEYVKATDSPPKVICSLRDIIMVKEFADRDFEERRRCQFTNQYYDGILMHSDPSIHRLENNISRVSDLTCPVYYTGYVVQSEPEGVEIDREDISLLNDPKPTIVVSVGGGKLGRDLLESTIQAAALLKDKIPHKIVAFTGPLMEEAQYEQLHALAEKQSNFVLRRFTPNLISYLNKADLSISLGGYNTTMNILKTGVRALIYPSNKDREQAIRAEQLERLNLLKILYPHDLSPEQLTQAITIYLSQAPIPRQKNQLQLNGAQEASRILQTILQPTLVAA
ncbi:glycosyltransferase family protein [Altericista sp. CCNU0014]|uniref:glycosyltransferase family protein n=1 Tax=Altericista sp. CCNU0014 TaxID=3082949 RepID=UPI0038503490